jgi:hypothetical protein
MKEIFRRKNSMAFSRQISPTSLLDVSASNCQKSLVDETRMIRNLKGKHNNSEMVAV